MQIPKSYWHYWYSGNKPVAITSMVLNAIVLGLVFVISAGFSIWGIIIAVLLDSLGLLFIVAYYFLRDNLPAFLLENGDLFILNQFIIPVCIAFVSGRLITFWVATFDPRWLRKGAIALVGLVVVGSAVALKIQYDHKKAIEEAAAQPGKIEKLKIAAEQIANDAIQSATNTANDVAESTGKLADDAAKSASQVAEDAKQKISETCESLADSLGKNPDEYCN